MTSLKKSLRVIFVSAIIIVALLYTLITMLQNADSTTIKIAKEEARKENGTLPKWIHDFSPKRYLSVADLKNAEARLFDYSGEMKEFSKIRVPMLAIFGSKETPTQIKPKKMLEILGEKSKTLLVTAEIKGANHGFTKKEKELCNCITLFLKIIRCGRIWVL